MTGKLCAYVELAVAYENSILEFPCQNLAVHGMFCEDHKCLDYDPAECCVDCHDYRPSQDGKHALPR